MDFNLNDEQELFVAGIRELRPAKTGRPILPSATVTASTRTFCQSTGGYGYRQSADP